MTAETGKTAETAKGAGRARENGWPRISFEVIDAAGKGDGDALMLILKHFDGYMRRLARMCSFGTSYLNEEVYERLKMRLVLVTMGFRILPPDAPLTDGMESGAAVGAADGCVIAGATA